jgi:16S rRNA (cytidine1402-2'-O)-methyltransferase
MSGRLYVVATPIGNLEDVSARVRRVLSEVDGIAAEDTRTARKLLDLLGISAPTLKSYFEGNEASRSAELIDALTSGEDWAVVSEAGTPAVSDPGQRLVDAAIAAGIAVEPIPGPSAVLAALVASGLPCTRFSFIGFLSREAGARAQELGALRGREETLIFYESPERVAATLRDMVGAFGGDRRAVLARELTKKHEEFVRGTVQELADRFAAGKPRGECTLVVEGGRQSAEEVDIEAMVRELLEQGLGPKDVAARLMVKTGKSRRELYQLALALRREE